MAVSRLSAVDLRKLAATDPEAAQVGYQLNSPQGVNLDGNPLSLRQDEFQATAPFEFANNPPLRPALLRLEKAFELAPPPPGPTGPSEVGLVRASQLSPVARGGLLMPGVVFTSSTGRQTAFAGRFDTGEVIRAAAPRGAPFQAVGTGLRASGVAGVRISGADWLYTVDPDPAGRSQLSRRRVSAAGLGQPERVPVTPQLPALHWPQLTALPDGRVVLGVVDPGKAPFVAVSKDGGKSFQVTANLAHTAQDVMTLVHLGSFGDGTLVATTQVADAQGVQSFVRTSADGVRFSAPVRVTTANPNVHDAFPAQRADGDVDLYYLREGAQGFSAYRRLFSRDGRLGPEQRLTGDDVGWVEKPQASRLPDGRVRLVMARKRPGDQFDLVSALLPGDAPRR